MHDALVVGKRSIEKLAAFLIQQVLRKVEVLNFAGTNWVLSDRKGEQFHVLCVELAVSEVQVETTLGNPVEEVGPLRSSLLDDHLGLEIKAPVGEIRLLKVNKFQLELHLAVKLLLLHGFSHFAVSVPVLMVLVRDVHLADEDIRIGVAGYPVAHRKSLE